jgi:hypothetical protein
VAIRGTEHSSHTVRSQAVAAISRLAQDGKVTSQDAAAVADRAWHATSWIVREASVAALGMLGELAAPHAWAIVARLQDSAEVVRVAAASAIRALEVFVVPLVASVAAIIGAEDTGECNRPIVQTPNCNLKSPIVPLRDDTHYVTMNMTTIVPL